jgi:hypothetical protein
MDVKWILIFIFIWRKCRNGKPGLGHSIRVKTENISYSKNSNFYDYLVEKPKKIIWKNNKIFFVFYFLVEKYKQT